MNKLHSEKLGFNYCLNQITRLGSAGTKLPQRFPRHQMKMSMKHCLPSIRSLIGDHAKALLIETFVRSELGNGGKDVGQLFSTIFRHTIDIGSVFFMNKKVVN